MAGRSFRHRRWFLSLVLAALGFLAGETSIELIVLSDQGASDPPRDPISGGPLDMRGIDELRSLIDAEAT